MSHFSEMDWNTKWDWENLVAFGSKAIESPKKLHLADWMIVDEGEIHAGSFNLSAGGGNSGVSGSDGAKSSISASTDSSTPNFRFSTFEGNSGNLCTKMEMNGKEVSGTSPPPEASVGSAEPLIGLKLGKRTYFENSGGGGGNVKSSSLSVMPNQPTTTLKKTKSSGHNVAVCCQVEGCNVDLSLAKDYHRKHRVCDNHSKSPKVVVGGLERRFCQQCSRFHNLSEFDDKKRSCRRRLSDHNARRRKPQQETIQFNSTRLSSTFYGGSQQMSFLLNNSPVIHPRTSANSTWDNDRNSKFTLTKLHSSKSNGDGRADEQLHMQGMKLPHAINMQTAANGLLASKNSTSEVLNPGSKGSMISSLGAAPEYGCALSLLSSNSWDSSCPPDSIPLYNPMHENDPVIHAIPQTVPLSSYEFWPNSTNQRVQPLPANTNFQEIQLLKAPYDADFYSNMLN